MPILHYPQAAKNNGHDHLQTGFALLPPLWWEEEKRVERQGLSTCVRKLSYHFEYLFFWSGIYLVTMNFQLFPGLQSRFSSCLLLQCFCWGTRAWSFLFYLFLMSFQISTAALFFLLFHPFLCIFAPPIPYHHTWDARLFEMLLTASEEETWFQHSVINIMKEACRAWQSWLECQDPSWELSHSLSLLFWYHFWEMYIGKLAGLGSMISQDSLL